MASNYLKQGLLNGLHERGYTLAEMLSLSGGGASMSIVFRGEKAGNPVALKIASYGFLNSFAGENVEKLEDFRRREIETLRLAGNHPNIPNYVESFSIDGENHDPIHVLVMEYLDYPSIAARIKKGERLSSEEPKILLRDTLSAEDYLHTGLPTQIIHRDVKTQNVLINGQKAYLIDFDIVKQGDRDSTRATQIEANGYYPPDFYAGIEEAQKPEHDVVALGNVAVAGISGKEIGSIRYEQGLYGLEPVDTSHLNVSPEIRRYLGKMIAPKGQRFQTAREALEGLERILGLSARIESKPQTPVPARQEEQNKFISQWINFIDETDENGNLMCIPTAVPIDKKKDWTRRTIPFKQGNSAYENLRNLRNVIKNLNEPETVTVEDATLSYLHHLGYHAIFPILRDVYDGKATLEGMLREKKQYNPFLTRRTRAADLEAGEIQNDWEVNIFSPTEESIKRRKQLLNVFGMKEEDFKFIGDGSIIGAGIGCVGGYLIIAGTAIGLGFGSLSTLMGFLSTPLGAIAGSNIVRSYFNHKLTSKAHEMDSWFREARVSQGLEGKVEDVGLSEEEKKLIKREASAYSGVTAGLMAMGGLASDLVGLPKELSVGLVIGSLPMLTPLGTRAFYHHYTKRALKQKRIAAGLPEDGITCSETLRVSDEGHRRLRDTLSRAGLKKKLLRKRFIGQDVRVSYQDCYFKEGIDASLYHNTDVTIRAASREKLEQIQKALKPLELSAEQTEKPEITSRGMDHGWGGFGT